MAADSPNTTGISSLWRSRRKAGADIAQAADEAGEAVGLYLTGQQAFLARVRSSRNRFPVVSEHLAVTLDPQPDQAAEELRDHLRMIGGGRMPRRLWTCLQSPGMVLQALRVPQVRASAMASAAFWTLKKERNLETEDTVFDIERLRTVDEDGVTRNELLAVAVPKAELAEHQQLIAAMATETAGICPPVFAFRNYLRLGYPELSRRPCAVLFVNDASSDVFVFQAGQVLAVRTLRTGLDSLRDTIAQTLDIDAGDPRADACLKLLAGEAVDVSVFGDDAPPSAEDVFSWGRPVARRLARNIQRTLHAFEDTLEGSEAASFFVSGTITRYQPLVDFLGEQMGLVLTPFTPSKSEFLQDVVEEGEPPPEESGMSLAVGLALAESYHTPNLLFTYEDRQKLQRRIAIARAVRAVFPRIQGILCRGDQPYPKPFIGGQRSDVWQRLASPAHPHRQPILVLGLPAGPARRPVKARVGARVWRLPEPQPFVRREDPEPHVVADRPGHKIPSIRLSAAELRQPVHAPVHGLFPQVGDGQVATVRQQECQLPHERVTETCLVGLHPHHHRALVRDQPDAPLCPLPQVRVVTNRFGTRQHHPLKVD